ncbi:MAG TPA: HEAT repeat domain-containing protein [Kofleriaceae bacterium]|nr:HEAT repeat domain-containing protein [Kofleriaceae bacterium]
MVRRFSSISNTSENAELLAGQGRWTEAERQYRELIGQTHVINYEYDDWLRRLGEIYRQLRRNREAAFVHLYLHELSLVRSLASTPELTALRARLAEIEKRWADAVRLYREANMPVHAAVALERGDEVGEAAAAWESLRQHPGLARREYEAALTSFNYGMAAERHSPGSSEARRALIDSQRRLEQVADELETVGERERAFDCFQILLRLGKESKQFENLAEGYLNCIRVLKDDNLKFYALQYYEDFIRLALERDEYHAAATLYQEAAAYSARAGLPYDRHYQHKAALTWVRCAETFVERGAPVQMVENALLAATSQFSAVGDYASVRTSFERLGQLELPDRARKRFRAIAARYAGMPGAAINVPGLPSYLKQQHAYADIWFADLLEWEMDGDPLAVAASIIGDLKYPNGIRRRALVVALTVCDAQQRQVYGEPEGMAQLAELLGELQTYAALAPLEKLYARAEPVVRRAAVAALRHLYFKRSFVILRKALQDADSQVREAAVRAMLELHFPHAFNPLARIFRESTDERVRGAALKAISMIRSVEAGEFLIMVMRHDSGDARAAARAGLAAMDNPDVLPIIRQHFEIEPNPEVREALGEMLRRV